MRVGHKGCAAMGTVRRTSPNRSWAEVDWDVAGSAPSICHVHELFPEQRPEGGIEIEIDVVLVPKLEESK